MLGLGDPAVGSSDPFVEFFLDIGPGQRGGRDETIRSFNGRFLAELTRRELICAERLTGSENDSGRRSS